MQISPDVYGFVRGPYPYLTNFMKLIDKTFNNLIIGQTNKQTQNQPTQVKHYLI